MEKKIFKKGDRVRSIAEYSTSHGWFGYVNYEFGLGFYSVTFDGQPDWENAAFGVEELELISEDPSPSERKFKVGDRVRTNEKGDHYYPTALPSGIVGTISEVVGYGGAFMVTPDDGYQPSDCVDWCYSVDELELLPETTSSPETIFDVGDRVISTKDGLRGVVTELVNSRNSDFYFVWVRFDGPGFSETRRDSELVFEGEPIKTFTGYRTGDITDTHNEDQRNDSKEPQYYGCVFPNGRTVLSWNTSVESLSVFDSYAEFEKIHGHYEDGYGTFIAWDKK